MYVVSSVYIFPFFFQLTEQDFFFLSTLSVTNLHSQQTYHITSLICNEIFTPIEIISKTRTCSRRHALNNHFRWGIGSSNTNIVVREIGSEPKEFWRGSEKTSGGKGYFSFWAMSHCWERERSESSHGWKLNARGYEKVSFVEGQNS